MKYMTASQDLMAGYWAEFVWNIASLFGRQTISVSCRFRRQILHIWLDLIREIIHIDKFSAYYYMRKIYLYG